MPKEYTNIVNLDDDDDANLLPEEIEIDLEGGEPKATAPAARDPEPPADPVDPPADDDEPPAPDPRDRRIALLEQQLSGVTSYLTDAQVRAAKAGKQSRLQDIDGKIAQTRAKLKAATEAGDADAILEATEALTDLKVDRRVIDMTPDEDPAPAVRQQQPAQAGYQPPAPAQEWMARNSSWFDRKGFEAESLLARAIDRSLVEEGWSPDSPAYYREMNKRIAAKTRLTPQDIGGPRRQTTPVPNTAAPRGTVAARKGSVRLNKDDFEIMRMTGLDPQNKDHLKEYAFNKRKEGL